MPEDDLASHFEDVLDKEEGIEPEKAPRRARDDDEDQPEHLFPEQETDEERGRGRGVTPTRRMLMRHKPPEEEEEKPEPTALDLDQIVAVNVDGQRAEVSLQEALNGYVRSETFHRRLNQLQQVAQTIEKERAVLAQERNYYAN